MTEEEKAGRAAQRAAFIAKARDGAAPKPAAAPEPEPVEAAAEPEPVSEPDAAAAERRRRLLGDVDPETAALFSDAELAQIEADEYTKARAEAKKQALADVRAVARQMARVDNDLIPASQLRSEDERRRLAEPVRFKVTLPGDGSGFRGQNGFRVDGRLYQVGREYTVTRAEFESLRSNHYRAWLNEVRFKTLDQHKPGNSAQEVLAATMPQFEIAA